MYDQVGGKAWAGWMAFAGHFAMIPPLRTSSVSPAGLMVFVSGSAAGVFICTGFGVNSSCLP